MWEFESAIAVAFWALGPFLSIFLLLLIGSAIGAVIDGYFAGRIEDGLRADYDAAHAAHLECIDYAKELEAELDKLKRKRDQHGRYVAVTQADGYDS